MEFEGKFMLENHMKILRSYVRGFALYEFKERQLVYDHILAKYNTRMMNKYIIVENHHRK